MDEVKRQIHGDWIEGAPCEHPGMVIANCTLGNVALINFVREVISGTKRNPGSQYPVIWSKVIYSGCHSGDWLNLAEVRRLKAEVARLRLIQVGETAQNRATKDPLYLEELLRKLDGHTAAPPFQCLKNLESSDQSDFHEFLMKLDRLIDASLRVRKPIVFY